MASYREQRMEGDRDIRPFASVNCNFPRATESKPSLLSFGELETLFHEFGHALHSLLSRCRFLSVSGTHVYWDFVELPSQIMENWCYEEESLNILSSHYESGAVLPMLIPTFLSVLETVFCLGFLSSITAMDITTIAIIAIDIRWFFCSFILDSSYFRQ